MTTSFTQDNPYKILDGAALTARSGDDRAMHALADAVFAFPRMLPIFEKLFYELDWWLKNFLELSFLIDTKACFAYASYYPTGSGAGR